LRRLLLRRLELGVLVRLGLEKSLRLELGVLGL